MNKKNWIIFAIVILIFIGLILFWYNLQKQNLKLAHEQELERIETQKQKELEVIEARQKADADEAYNKIVEEYLHYCENAYEENAASAIEGMNKYCGSDEKCANDRWISLMGPDGGSNFVQNCINKKLENSGQLRN